jgi:aminoglycoside phosphotransferase (APT) family kinase protein
MQLRIDFKLPEYKTKLKNEISRTGLLTEDVKSKLYEYIDQLADDNILCHGDFHPDNVLIAKDRAVIIDWMTAARGNPLADVARTSIMFKFGDVSEKPYLEKKMINFFRTKFLSEYINHYMDISSVKLEQIEQWELPVAAARLSEGIPDSEKMTLLNFINCKIGLIS